MNQPKTFDFAIIGGGIIGVAHALEAAERGSTVVLFERDNASLGASVRNFGMIWPIGQRSDHLDTALYSRSKWLKLAQSAGFWASPAGSLHLAHHADEQAILEEFVYLKAQHGYQVRLLTADEACRQCPAVKKEGLRMAMLSESEVNIDPRQALQKLHQYLQSFDNVEIVYQTAITRVDYPMLSSGTKNWFAREIIICSGIDFETLYPENFSVLGMLKCKLQMMRTFPQPSSFSLGPNLAAGLTLQHYEAFQDCPSLPMFKKRIAEEMPLYNEYGIHVLLSATAAGELTIGDSHEYGTASDPFLQTNINELILRELHRFAHFPNTGISSYWAGYYAKNKSGQPVIRHRPENEVTIVNGAGGAGMTLSFGLAKQTVDLLVSE